MYAQSFAALIMIRVYELQSLTRGGVHAGMSVAMQKFTCDMLVILKPGPVIKKVYWVPMPVPINAY